MRTSQTTGRVSGGAALVAALRDQGVDRIFCVPGESYLPVLDALVDVPEITVVSARHEGAAANMAEADGKLTGRPGICIVTRGPGATHASVGVHSARQASTPMILFIGQVARGERDREGFQEVDYRAMFAPLAKWVAEIDDAVRIPEYVARAYRIAMSGRAGPVVLALPEDVLTDEVQATLPLARIEPPAAAPRRSDLDALVARISQSRQPLVVMGGTGWTDDSLTAVERWAERAALPLVASFRRQDLVDARSPNYCGHLGLGIDPCLAERVRTSDLVVSLGSRLSENTTGGYALLTPPVASQPLIHVYPDPDELGRVYQPTLAIAATLPALAEALDATDVCGAAERSSWLRAAREDYLRFSTPPAASDCRYVDLADVVGHLSDALSDDAVIANGAGNYTIWVHRFFRYRAPRTQLAPVSGAMGYGLPAAIAAKLRDPGRDVIAFAGDGCFLMYPQELATAVQHRANVIVLVVDNASYGTIRMHQERRYPGRVIATDLVNPDFVALAHSFGAYGERVERSADFPAAFARAREAGTPALLHLRVDPAQSTPTMRL